MESLSALMAFIQHELTFVSWRDVTEILFFTSITYGFIRWLNQDKQKSLVFWFYGYCIATFGSYFAQLNTLNLVLCFSAPIVLMLFVILHQQMLQKNFVALKNITPKVDKKYHWLEELMQACLHAINKNREVICVIERTDSLELFLTAPSSFNANVSREILELLISTAEMDKPIVLWVNHAGRLVTLNPMWHVHPDETWISDEIKALHKRKQDALFITEKSDAVIFTLSPTTRLFDVVVEGKTINKISAGHAFELLKKYSNLHEKDGTTAHTKQRRPQPEQNV